jgi:hypothetical protein
MFLGTFSNIASLTSQLTFHVSSITSALDRLDPIMADSPNLLSQDQARSVIDTAYDALSTAVTAISRLFATRASGKTPRLVLSECPNSLMFSTMFSDFVRLGLEFYGCPTYSPLVIFPYLASFSHLHYWYFELVMNPAFDVDVPKFRNIWRRQYFVLQKIRLPIKEIDFPGLVVSFDKTVQTLTRAGIEGVGAKVSDLTFMVKSLAQCLSKVCNDDETLNAIKAALFEASPRSQTQTFFVSQNTLRETGRPRDR